MTEGALKVMTIILIHTSMANVASRIFFVLCDSIKSRKYSFFSKDLWTVEIYDKRNESFLISVAFSLGVEGASPKKHKRKKHKTHRRDEGTLKVLT